MPDGDENAVGIALGQCAGLDVLEPHAGSPFIGLSVAHHVVERAVPDDVDLGMLEQPLLQDLFPRGMSPGGARP